MKSRKIDLEFGFFMYNIAKKSNLTDNEIASKLGVEERTLRYYYSGQRKPEQRKIIIFLDITNSLSINVPF